ncbi:glutathione-dependent formaldehyde dehydrogenase [Microbacterium sp. AISO3]|jgi:threonine dehydrogenase-like Zn-dependent dehydrogenase|uniref:Threonine dehydrogenase-like Zn-dependent dehydrogenase n=2 Tax=Microbacterium TaxID=33882 RepID=A0ABU1HZN7_9MICO|nr:MULTISPECIES: alcohol dehydrogenase catalytic domain-containing protein [Microbacterium]MDR6166861.1 threonine dehydrogenase-like Zn-dependent dehydrogenase [Microbacterium paludicola]OAZ45696.1 glutathione-dependent formaldehyde dehydrogenase [Microbacterium arborescens]OWP22454.1 glutathione-dependent formaldehyde dehydrogenase [Microbacterium sp. AISO3]POX66528.1 glutathione-dependent formaldehyde dehydrogenase [Microbacterium sp. Ru50]GAD35323.1 alcohol dehydrogenase [Microbacterium sp.
MKAVVWHGIGDIRLDEVDEPRIEDGHDAIVRITRSAICGTDLHFIRGTMSGMRDGTILGHEAVGVVTEVGEHVRGFQPGDRVVINSTMSCGACRYCRDGHTAQCDVANPNGPHAGTSFFGGPEATGPVDGLQAEYARIPWAQNTMTKLPDAVSDDQAILLSDIFPTAWFGAQLAGVSRGDVVVVLGAGIVGQFSVVSAFKQGAGRVIVVDGVADRLEQARTLGAEVVDFNDDDPVAAVMELTNDIGADCVIDAVGVDAERPARGPAAPDDDTAAGFDEEVAQVAPDIAPQGDLWRPGDAPSQASRWAVEMVAKYGRIGIIGVYSPLAEVYPIGQAMNKNLTVRMGNCDHHSVTPPLIDMVAAGVFDPTALITAHETLAGVIDAYEAFDRREPGWIKVALDIGG